MLNPATVRRHAIILRDSGISDMASRLKENCCDLPCLVRIENICLVATSSAIVAYAEPAHSAVRDSRSMTQAARIMKVTTFGSSYIINSFPIER